MQQKLLQTATTDRVAYAKNAQSILERLKAIDMELIEATLAYALQVFQSNEQPLRKLLVLTLIKDAIVFKCAKFINKYVSAKPLLTFIGNICTHKLGDSSYDRGEDLFQGQDPQSSCEFLRLALELVEYLAITYPIDSKGAPTKFKMQFDELKQMGVEFYPQSELMNPFDPHSYIDAYQSQLTKASQFNRGDDKKERNGTMLELNNMKQTLYQNIEMINDLLQNESDIGQLNEVMETYSESLQELEVNLAKQINKAVGYKGLLTEDKLAELQALKDFTQKFQNYYKEYLSELCTPDAFQKMKQLIQKHIQQIYNQDFDQQKYRENKLQESQQRENQFFNEEEQLERIKQQSKIEYDEQQKSQITYKQHQLETQQHQKEDEQYRQEQDKIQREKDEEARYAKLREEHFQQEQLRQQQIKEEYERYNREEQQRKEQERLQQEKLQSQQKLYQKQYNKLELSQPTVKSGQINSDQIQQQRHQYFQNQDYKDEFQTQTAQDKIVQNIEPNQLLQQQQNYNNIQAGQNINEDKSNQQIISLERQTSSFGQVINDNQYSNASHQFEQPMYDIENENKINFQSSSQQVNKYEYNFEENFDGLSQSTQTQQFFPLQIEQKIPMKQYVGQLIEYKNTQFDTLKKILRSASGMKRFKIASLKGKAALVNSQLIQIGVLQQLRYVNFKQYSKVPLKEKNYLKLKLYFGNKTEIPFDKCRAIFEGDNQSFQIWLKPEKIQERIEPGKQISQEIIGNFRDFEYKLINVIFQGQWGNKSISVNFCIPTTLVSFMDFKDISLQIFRAQWRGKKRFILKSETFLLDPKIVKTAYHIKKQMLLLQKGYFQNYVNFVLIRNFNINNLNISMIDNNNISLTSQVTNYIIVRWNF